MSSSEFSVGNFFDFASTGCPRRAMCMCVCVCDCNLTTMMPRFERLQVLGEQIYMYVKVHTSPCDVDMAELTFAIKKKIPIHSILWPLACNIKGSFALLGQFDC